MVDTTLALSPADSILGADENSDDAWGWQPENIQAEKEGKKIHVAQVLRSRRMVCRHFVLFCFYYLRFPLVLEGVALKLVLHYDRRPASGAHLPYEKGWLWKNSSFLTYLDPEKPHHDSKLGSRHARKNILMGLLGR